MKKTLFVLAVAAATLTSCVKSEIVDVAESRVISFDAHIDKATKAVATINTSGLTNFYVYCAKGTTGTGDTFTADDATTNFFDGVEVIKSGNSYDYAHKQWEGGKTYRFMAYSDGNDELSSANVNFVPAYADNTTWGLEINNYAAGANDLLVGSTSGEVKTNQALTNHTTVNLGLNHALSRVQFVFFTKIATGCSLRINDFDVEAYTTGDLVVKNSNSSAARSIEWTPETNGSYHFTDPEAISGSTTPNLTDYDKTGYVLLPSTINKVVYEAYVIPQSNASLEVSITIQTLGSDGSVLSTIPFNNISLALPDHTSWLPGNIYSYQAELGTSSHDIHFSTIVYNWVDDSYGDKNITPSNTVSGE